MVRRAISLALISLLAACTPELDDRSFLIAGPRLLAISSTPAEAAPPAEVSYRALYVDAHGDRSADLEWSFCVTRKALADEGTVSPRCIAPGGDGLVPIGEGAEVTGALPMSGCRLFGPDRPDPVAGQPAGRPADPDPSGGFYQPVRLRIRDGGDAYAIGATRISCGLGGATPAVAADYAKRYVKNENPAFEAIELDGVAIEQTGATVKRGARVSILARWSACDPEAAAGCTGAEPYLVFDPSSRALVARREAIRVAWFATGGELADDDGGRGADEADVANLSTTWIAPKTSGDANLCAVIRDDRGGVGWSCYRITVE